MRFTCVFPFHKIHMIHTPSQYLILLFAVFASQCEATAPVLKNVKKGSSITCKKPSSGGKKFMQCGVDYELADVTGPTFVRARYVEAGSAALTTKDDFDFSKPGVQVLNPVTGNSAQAYTTSGAKAGGAVFIQDGGEKDYDIYIVAMKEQQGQVIEISEVIKVDVCKCPPDALPKKPPTLSNLKQGSKMECRKPSSGEGKKFMQCGVDFELGDISGPTFVRVRYVEAGSAALTTKDDFDFSKPGVQVMGKVTGDKVDPYTTSGAKTGEAVFIEDGGEKDYDIYMVATAEENGKITEMSEVKKVDVCKCPTEEKKEEKKDDGFPTWAIVLIVLFIIALIGILLAAMKGIIILPCMKKAASEEQKVVPVNPTANDEETGNAGDKSGDNIQ